MKPPRLVAGQHKTFVQSDDGLMWVCEPGSEDGYGPLHAEQEPEGCSVHDFIMDRIRPGEVFMDIGAHVGHYSVRAARKGAGVIAVEANPMTCSRLLENLRLNKLTARVFAVALWDSRRVLHLAYGDNTDGDVPRSGGMRTLPFDSGYGVEVPALPGDTLLIDRADVVKIDTEGADVRILRGLRQTLARCKPVIVVEDHSVYSYYPSAELDDEQSYLSSVAGYTWKGIGEYGVKGVHLNYRVGTVN